MGFYDYSPYIERKLCVAKNLYNDQCGGGYDDAIIILAATIGAISADVWPGTDHIDRKRFIELCVLCGSPDLEIKKISIPLLIEHLHATGEQTGVAAIKDKFPKAFRGFPFYGDDLIITGRDVDLFENEVQQILTIETKALRKFSYATLFYEEFRCGFIHKGAPNERSTFHSHSIVMGMDEEPIEYTNVVLQKTNRQIRFSYQWIEQLVLSIGEYFDTFLSEEPLFRPDSWWIDG
jgi:hypothetical protein